MFRTETQLSHTTQYLSELLANGEYNDAVVDDGMLANTLSLYSSGGPLVADSDDGLTLSLGGNATATGDDTLATGQMDGFVVDQGPVSIGFGSATFTAAAEGSDGSAGYASASSFADALGADFIIRFGSTSASSGGDGQTSQTSQSTILAIDFEGWDFADGPVELDLSGHENLLSPGGLTGNVAEFNSDMKALGENTIADLDYTVLTVEDSFSDVSAFGVVGVA